MNRLKHEGKWFLEHSDRSVAGNYSAFSNKTGKTEKTFPISKVF